MSAKTNKQWLLVRIWGTAQLLLLWKKLTYSANVHGVRHVRCLLLFGLSSLCRSCEKSLLHFWCILRYHVASTMVHGVTKMAFHSRRSMYGPDKHTCWQLVMKLECRSSHEDLTGRPVAVNLEAQSNVRGKWLWSKA